MQKVIPRGSFCGLSEWSGMMLEHDFEAVASNTKARRKLLDYDTVLLRELTGRDLREIFRGLCGRRV